MAHALQRTAHISRAMAVCIVQLALLLMAAPLAAQPAAPAGAIKPPANDAAEPPGYRATIDSAIAEHEQGHFAESRALFSRAHALFPNARTLRGLGMAEFELRNYAQSCTYLEAALASTVKPLEAELKRETEGLLERSRGFVGRYRLQLQPAAASVSLDGAALTLAPEQPLVLSVGDHVLDVSAAGYSSEQRGVHVTGGEDQVLQFNLPIAPVAAQPSPVDKQPPASLATPPPAETSSLLESPWLWVAVGAAVVAGGVGIGLAAAGGGSTHEAAAMGGTTNLVLDGPAAK